MGIQNEVQQFLSIIDNYKKEQSEQAIDNYHGYEKLFTEPYFHTFLKSSPLVVAVYNYPLQRYTFISESVTKITCLKPEDFTKENGAEALIRAMDERARKAMLETIMPSLMKACATFPSEIKNLRFSSCVQIHQTETIKKWVLMNLYILEATPEGFPLLSCTLVQDVDMIKKDDLIYFSERLLKSDNQEVMLRQGVLSDKEEELNLSKREVEVLQYICKGYNTAEIAEKMFVSFNTIKKHRTNILNKNNCSNTPELINKAMIMGVI
jgi:DNA-binding CsgD family transcriptional regulator